MSEVQQYRAHERAEEAQIIDADFHLHLPHEELYPYIDVPTIRRALEEAGPPTRRSSVVNSGYAKGPSLKREKHDSHFGSAYTIEDIREVKDVMGLDTLFVCPGTNLQIGRGLYPRVSGALLRAYNDYVRESVIDLDEGIYAAIYLPEWDVDLAVAELDRLGAEPGFVGAANWLTNDRLWGDAQYDPVFEKLVALDLPLALHVLKFNLGPDTARISMRTHAEHIVSAYSYTMAANLSNMVFTGVFDAFPDLDVVFQEAGTLWIPYMAWRMDELYQAFSGDLELAERFIDGGKRYLDRRPSEYVFDNVFVTTQPIELTNVRPRSHVEPLLEICHAEDMLLFSSDWPHPTTDPSDWLFDLPIGDDLRERIAHGNAERVLRFPT